MVLQMGLSPAPYGIGSSDISHARLANLCILLCVFRVVWRPGDCKLSMFALGKELYKEGAESRQATTAAPTGAVLQTMASHNGNSGCCWQWHGVLSIAELFNHCGLNVLWMPWLAYTKEGMLKRWVIALVVEQNQSMQTRKK
jgi:hypothetical protein